MKRKYTIIREVPIQEKGIIIKNEGTDDRLCTLSNFLHCEMTSIEAYNFFTSWLKDEIDQEEAFGNAYGLTKKNNKVLVHEQEFLSGKEEPEEYDDQIFVTTKENLLIIIDDWLRTILSKLDPFAVKIKQDESGKVEFEWLGGPEKPNEN